MTDYPPFSGDTPACSQCGHQGASTEYRATPCLEAGNGHVRRVSPPDPHLHRECERCGYQWDEATVS